MAAFDKLKSKYKAGQYVFKDGDLGTEMYTVSAGRIALIKEVSGREIVIATMEKGDFFGEMAVLESLPRNLSARVEDDGTELIAINGSTFDKMIKSNIEIAVRMLRKFSTRLREADADALRLREKCQALEQEVTAFAARPAMAPVVVPAASPTHLRAMQPSNIPSFLPFVSNRYLTKTKHRRVATNAFFPGGIRSYWWLPFATGASR